MSATTSKPPVEPGSEADMVEHVVHQYQLTRQEARDLVVRHGSDPDQLDAAAGKLKSDRMRTFSGRIGH